MNYNLNNYDYIRFRELILERTGLHFPEKKKSDLETGLFRALSESSLLPNQNGEYNLDAYYNLLKKHQAELDRLINTLTIGETHFFRDEPQFNALAGQVLPKLIEARRAAAAAVGFETRPQLRIWSAGCASGEEPYSIAILLKELLPDIHNWYIFILGTDINQNSLQRARQGIYSEWSFREKRAKTLRPKYFNFNPANNRYHLRDEIRQMVTFRSLNLIEDEYPSIPNNTVSMDLILCRNVTIYFTAEVTQIVIDRFYKTLIDGGWLVVGHSEPSLLTYRAFQARNFPDTVLYQKTGQPTAWPEWLAEEPARSSFVSDPPSPPLSAPPPPPPRPAPTPTRPPPPPDPYQQARELLDNGQIEEAIQKLHHKVGLAPDFAPAHSLLGLAYANLGNWSEAQRWCQKSLQLDKLQSEPYYVLGLVYQHEGETETAIQMLKKAIYLERETPLPHFHLAVLYNKSGQKKNARRAFQNVIRILEKWPPEKIVPDTGGTPAKKLLDTTRRLLKEFG